MTNDAHVELLDAQIIFHPHEAAPSLDLEPAERESLAADMAVLAMECVGVDGALWHGERAVCDAAVTKYPDLFRGIVYYADPTAVEDIEAELAWVKEHPGMRGIRLTPAWPATPESIARLHDGLFDPWLAGIERLGLALSLFMPGHLPEVSGIAEKYPSLRIMVDHIGMFPAPIVELVPERLDAIPQLLALARHDNVAVKFTGVPSLSFEEFPFADMWPASHQILDAFGIERVMWGSDFRRIRSLHTYEELVDFVRLTDEVSLDEKKMLCSGSLRKWVGWDA